MFKRILILNGIAVIFLGIDHAASWGFSAMFQWTDRYIAVSVPNYDQLGSLAYYFTLMLRQFTSADVPIFLFVSGFFIAFASGGSQKKLKWKIVLNRLKALIWPFIIWTIVRFIILLQVPTSLGEILKPFYYIVLLAQLYLLAPFLVPIARTRWKSLLTTTAILHIGIQGLRSLRVLGIGLNIVEPLVNLTPGNFFPTALIWFTLGMVTGFHRDALRFHRQRWFLVGLTLIFGCFTLVEYEGLAYLAGREWLGPAYYPAVTHFAYVFAFLLTYLAFDGFKPPFAKQVSNLGSKSLGVYFGNQNANYLTALFMYKVTPWILGKQWLYQPILVIAGIGFPILLIYLIRISPIRKYNHYLFG